MKEIDQFVSQVRSRINRHRALNALLWSLAIGAGLLLLVALTYIVRGYSVPTFWYPLAIIGTLAGAVVATFARRADMEETSRFTDDFFELKDSVTSTRSFEKADRHGGLYELQAAATMKKVEPLSPETIRWQWPRRVVAAAGILAVASALTAFKSPSQRVLEKLEIEATTLDRSLEVKEELKELIEELDKSLEDDERPLVNPDKLKKWVEELEETKDRKEAMRQLAELERKIRKEVAMEEQKRDEQLLAQAARELEKAQETKELAKNLKQQKYREAGKDLKKMEPQKQKTLSQEKKDLARLKAASQRMAAAAKAADAKRKKKKPQLKKKQKKMEAGELGEMMGELDDSVREFEKMLELEEGEFEPGEIDEARGKIAKGLGKLDKKFGKLAARKKSQKKLLALSKKVGQCQSYLGKSRCESPFAAKGGKKAGTGTIESRREERDDLVDNGQTTALKGIKGTGPSLSKIEEAADGTGISNRKAEARELKIQRQFESFVQREDVPEDLKEGVKQYFNTIQNISDEEGVTQPGGTGEE